MEHLLITSNSSHFFNKTDAEQYLFKFIRLFFTIPHKKKRAKTKHFNLNVEEDDMILNFISDNPMLWNVAGDVAKQLPFLQYDQFDLVAQLLLYSKDNFVRKWLNLEDT